MSNKIAGSDHRGGRGAHLDPELRSTDLRTLKYGFAVLVRRVTFLARPAGARGPFHADRIEH